MDGNVRTLYKYRAGFLVPATKSDDVYVLQRKETSRGLEIAVYTSINSMKSNRSPAIGYIFVGLEAVKETTLSESRLSDIRVCDENVFTRSSDLCCSLSKCPRAKIRC